MKLINDCEYPNSINEKESSAWSAFVEAVKNFLENRKAVKYIEIVAELRSSLRGVNANISIKLYFLYPNLDRFSANLGDLSDEQVRTFVKCK